MSKAERTTNKFTRHDIGFFPLHSSSLSSLAHASGTTTYHSYFFGLEEVTLKQREKVFRSKRTQNKVKTSAPREKFCRLKLRLQVCVPGSFFACVNKKVKSGFAWSILWSPFVRRISYLRRYVRTCVWDSLLSKRGCKKVKIACTTLWFSVPTIL